MERIRLFWRRVLRASSRNGMVVPISPDACRLSHMSDSLADRLSGPEKSCGFVGSVASVLLPVDFGIYLDEQSPLLKIFKQLVKHAKY